MREPDRMACEFVRAHCRCGAELPRPIPTPLFGEVQMRCPVCDRDCRATFWRLQAPERSTVGEVTSWESKSLYARIRQLEQQINTAHIENATLEVENIRLTGVIERYPIFTDTRIDVLLEQLSTQANAHDVHCKLPCREPAASELRDTVRAWLRGE